MHAKIDIKAIRARDEHDISAATDYCTANGFEVDLDKMLSIEALDRHALLKELERVEAENRIFRSTESVDDSVWDALLEQIRQR